MTTQSAQSVFSVIITAAQDEIILDNDDITDVYFIEDIYSYLMSGRIVLKDTRGLSEFLPLVGNEKITIEYGTTSGETKDFYLTKTMEFEIVKFGWVESTQDKRRSLLEFFFIQEPHKRLHMEHYSRSYKCELYTDYVNKICDMHCGIFQWNHFESGNEKLQYFYTGLKTPAQTIEWLGSRSSGSVSGQPGYLLFANTESDFPYNFRTLESLLMNNVMMEPAEAGNYTLNAHNEYNINRILRLKDNKVDKRGLEMLIKTIGLGFDTKRKKHLRNEYSYVEALSKFTCLGEVSLFEEGIDDLISPQQILTGEVEEEEIMKNLYYGDWIKRYCLQHTVDIIVEGHSLRYAGGMIHVAMPSASDDEVYDKNMSGLYLVKSITHHFCPLNKPVYSQKMILIKNGYDKSDGRLTPAGKPNVIPKPPRIDQGTYNWAVRGL